jgi:hypothetical protein
MKNRNYWLLILSFLGTSCLTAQVQNNTSVYIADGTEAYLASGSFYFGNSPASTGTSRTSLVYGKLSFGAGATWAGASDSHYIDGYAGTWGNSSFVMPIGQSGVYAPVQVIPSASTGVDAAYFRSNPATIGSALANTVGAVSTIEYWNIKGSSSAIVSVSWRSSSNISVLTGGNINRLSILGWNGSSWNEIPSVVDTTSFLGGSSSLTTGSIASTSPVDLATYSYFTLGIKKPSCFELTPASGITKTWDGVWSPSEPTLADHAVINSAYSGSLSCNSLELHADITLANGQVAEIVNDVTGTGTIIMASEASVVQRNDLATAPKIEITKVTNPMRRLDYVYLSSPIDNPATYFADLANKNKVAVNGNFGTQTLSPFYDFTTYNAAGTARVAATAATTPIGTGHSASVRSQPPYSADQSPGAWYTEKYPISIKTSGPTNNGTISVAIPPNGWMYVGNPYPSAISGEKLLDAAGTNMRKTLYFWTFNTPRVSWSNTGSNYTNADYATWNYSGGVAACPTCQIPTGKIASMQSVLMRGIVPTASTLEITNCMRETSGNDNFFRTGSSVDNKFRLNLLGADNSFCQTLIVYSENGTLAYDSGYDGMKIASTTSSLTSLIGTTKCAIQTRPPFEDTDAVPLQVDTPVSQTLTVSLATKEGVFDHGNVPVYLHDILLGIYHNLSMGPYQFVQSETSNNSRFEVVYRNPTLGNPDLDTINALAFVKDQTFNAQAQIDMKQITIYDMAGRLIQTYNNINGTLINGPFHHAQGVYIAKIALTNGMVVAVKLINQ